MLLPLRRDGGQRVHAATLRPRTLAHHHAADELGLRAVGERPEDALSVVGDQIGLMRRYAALGPEMRPHARWLLKEAIFRIWELPGLKAPKLDKYSLHMPWSPRAYERVAGWVPGSRPRPSIGGLRFEQIIPRGLLADMLLDETPDDLGEFLDRYFRAAVLTVEDDHQLNAAGVRGRMPAGWHLGDDPWERYRKAGLDPDAFIIPVEAVQKGPATGAVDARYAA